MIRTAPIKPTAKPAADVSTPARHPAPKTVSAKPMPSPEKRGPGRPKGSGKGKSPDATVPFTIRLHPDVLARLQAKGPLWRSVAAGLIADGV